MPHTFTTADGPRLVRNWGYMLQGSGHGRKTTKLSIKDLKAQPHDLIVMDFSSDGSDKGAFNATDISALKARRDGNPVILSYISIGEASDYRDHWQDDWTAYNDPDQRAAGAPTSNAPPWLGSWNESWPNSRKVRYWDKGWQNIIFNDAGTGWLDKIVAAGFDGAYLDIVDGYYHWGCVVQGTPECRAGDPQTEREAAARMIDFVVALSNHARETNPEFLIFPQNGAYIIDALEDEDHRRRDAYLEAINAIACEDLFHRGDKPENNKFDPDKDAINTLVADFIDSGCAVFAVDYLSDTKKIKAFEDAAVDKGFIPYAAPSRELNSMGAPYTGGADKIA